MKKRMNSPYLIFGNFGNKTIALLQWVFEQKFQNVIVVNIDTGWSNGFWAKRVEQAQKLIEEHYNFQYVSLIPKLSFSELILDRKAFPSSKYQWCAYFLKGMTINLWLDQNDLDGDMTILLPRVATDEKDDLLLTEFIESSEFYGYRKIWHPLWKISESEMCRLIASSGIPLINSKSQECSPCIHADSEDLVKLSDDEIKRISRLEKKVNKNMFADKFNNIQDNGIRTIVNLSKVKGPACQSNIKKGCVNNWVCGL